MVAWTKIHACCPSCGVVQPPPLPTVRPTLDVFRLVCPNCGVSLSARFWETQER